MEKLNVIMLLFFVVLFILFVWVEEEIFDINFMFGGLKGEKVFCY